MAVRFLAWRHGQQEVLALYYFIPGHSSRIVGLNRVLEYFEVHVALYRVVYCAPLPTRGSCASLVTISDYAEPALMRQERYPPSPALSLKNRRQAAVSASCHGWSVEPVRLDVPGIDAVIREVLAVALRVGGQRWEDVGTTIVHELGSVPGSPEYCRFGAEQLGGRACLIGLYEDELGPYYAELGSNSARGSE